ncbi:MAG: hypothetical protein JXR83_11680, partial [Deltaproteobacteria bacterium]|nr:hypothetical protein [Deltaproteobacteria bacterium]
SPFGADFADSHAAHKVVPEGAIQSTVVRIAPRPNVCTALQDPTDDVSPSLVIVIKGTQVQKYQVVGLDYTPPAGATPPPVATVTLVRYVDCDGGAEDAGEACASNVSAASGEIELQRLVEGELAAGLFQADFAAGGAVDGTFSAPACATIR